MTVEKKECIIISWYYTFDYNDYFDVLKGFQDFRNVGWDVKLSATVIVGGYIVVNINKVLIIFDPPHLIKSLQNNFSNPKL